MIAKHVEPPSSIAVPLHPSSPATSRERRAEDRRVDRPWFLSRDTAALAIVLTFGTVLRVALMLGTSGILWPDSYLFYSSAEAMRSGDFFAHDAFKTPLYSAFLALFLAMGSTATMGGVVIAVQHLLGLLSTALFYRVARQVFDTPVACGSSLLFTGHTLLLFYETSVLSETLFVFLLSLLLRETLRALTAAAPWRWACVGALGGLVTLTRPVAQGFVVCLVLVVLVAGRASRRSLAAASLVGALYLATVLPWAFVNSQTYGFWGLSLGRGLGLFIRVFEIDKLEPIETTAYREVRDVLAWARARTHNVPYVVRNELNFAHGYSSYTADVAMFGFAFETVRAHPWLYARNSMRNWAHQLLVEREDPEICRARAGPYLCASRGAEMSNALFPNVPPPGHRALKRRIAAYFATAYIRMWVVVPLALIGMVWYVASRTTSSGTSATAAGMLLIAAILYFTGIPALLQWPEERYRLPIDALLFMFAVSGAMTIALGARSIGRRLRIHT